MCTAGLPIFLRPETSRLYPALVRIIISAIFLISDEIDKIDVSMQSKTYGPSITPVNIIPNRLGNLHFWHNQPKIIPSIKINAILNNIIISPFHAEKLTTSAFTYSQKSSAFISGFSI